MVKKKRPDDSDQVLDQVKLRRFIENISDDDLRVELARRQEREKRLRLTEQNRQKPWC